MAGQIKRLIQRLIDERSRGNPTLAVTTRTKLLLKGIRIDEYADSSPDDPAVIQQLRTVAGEMGITL